MFDLVKTLVALAPIQTSLAIVILCAPVLLALIFRGVALHAPANGHQVWFSYRQNSRLIFFATIGGWWALWKAAPRTEKNPKTVDAADS
jgi:hypothetical protein